MVQGALESALGAELWCTAVGPLTDGLRATVPWQTRTSSSVDEAVLMLSSSWTCLQVDEKMDEQECWMVGFLCVEQEGGRWCKASVDRRVLNLE